MVFVRRQKENRRRGTAAVEAALVMPVLMLITFGAIRYGWLFLKAQQITNAARYGARVAIRADATTQDVLDSISALLGPTGAKIIETGDPVPVTFKVNNVASGNIDPASNVGDSITVTISVPVADIDIMPLGVFYKIVDPDPFIIGASVTMAKEGA
ncbi:TadE/TadG family type IV pilus assembly protein [Planctomycetota bacterium]